MEIFSTKHKFEWRKQNDIVIASSCRETQNGKTTARSFTTAREQSCALSHKNNQSRNFSPLNSCSHSAFPLKNYPHLLQPEVILWEAENVNAPLKQQSQAAEQVKVPSQRSLRALWSPGTSQHRLTATDTWQQDRSLICQQEMNSAPNNLRCLFQ